MPFDIDFHKDVILERKDKKEIHPLVEKQGFKKKTLHVKGAQGTFWTQQCFQLD